MTELVEWLPGYKLVDAGFSFCAPYDGQVEYKAKEYTQPRPGCGSLAIFDTADNALSFFLESVPNMGVRIVPCAYVPSQQQALWTKSAAQRTRALLPEGTCFAAVVFCFE